MGQAIRFSRVPDRDERLLQQLLQVGLPHVDDVVGRLRGAKRRMRGFGEIRRGSSSPTSRRRPAAREPAIGEVTAQQPDFQNW